MICTAALSSLAPYDAHGDGLDWFADMVESNVEAYRMSPISIKLVIPSPTCKR